MEFRTIYMSGLYISAQFFIVLFATLVYCSAHPKPNFKSVALICVDVFFLCMSVVYTVYPLYCYAAGKYSVAEGIVKEFHAQPPGGHGLYEHFAVDGVYFEYSNYSPYYGYNRPRCFDGVITGDGQYLRISYVTTSTGKNRMIKIEEAKSADAQGKK